MLLVLEGLDGAGKSTQLGLLRERAQALGHEVESLHFPRFDTPLYGETIARFLRGEFAGGTSVSGGSGASQDPGTPVTPGGVDPYTVALLFAGDRAAAAPMIRGWLDAGKWVILDRYVYSNVAYQGAKVDDPAARERLRQWILELEYNIWGVPRPDVSLFLDVPFRFTEARLAAPREGADRQYLQGGSDVHETSLELQRRVREVYLDAARTDRSLRIVDCSDGGGAMLPPDKIFDKILSQIADVYGR
jgi:dTMP kinase